LLERIQKLCWSDSEENNAVLVEKLNENVHILERKHAYFIGLSVEKFSKNSINSPVLSDEELEKYLNKEVGNIRFRLEEEQKTVLGACTSGHLKRGVL
jgi:ATP-dependent helicase/DNAse subunit B